MTRARRSGDDLERDAPATVREMNDMSFRSRQLARLKDEVIELEDANEHLSLTDLNMNDYLHELGEYLKHTPEIRQASSGIHSITHAREDSDRKNGVLFCFKHRNLDQKPKKTAPAASPTRPPSIRPSKAPSTASSRIFPQPPKWNESWKPN